MYINILTKKNVRYNSPKIWILLNVVQKPVWTSLFCGTQNNIFWRTVFVHTVKISVTFELISLHGQTRFKSSTEERK